MAQFEVGCCVEDLTKENSWKQEAANSPGFSSDSTGLAGDTSKGPQEKHGTSQSAVFESFQTHKRYQTITPKGLRPNTVAGRTHPAHQNGHRDGLGLAGDVNCDVAPFRAGAAFFLASCHMEEAEKRNTQAETKTHTHTHIPPKRYIDTNCACGDPKPTTGRRTPDSVTRSPLGRPHFVGVICGGAFSVRRRLGGTEKNACGPGPPCV